MTVAVRIVDSADDHVGLGNGAVEALERDLVAEIKDGEDNLRFYRIAELKGYEVREHGFFRATDFDAPLVL